MNRLLIDRFSKQRAIIQAIQDNEDLLESLKVFSWCEDIKVDKIGR